MHKLMKVSEIFDKVEPFLTFETINVQLKCNDGRCRRMVWTNLYNENVRLEPNDLNTFDLDNITCTYDRTDDGVVRMFRDHKFVIYA